MPIQWGCEKYHKAAETDYSTYLVCTDGGSDRRGASVYNRGFCRTCSAKVTFKAELKTTEDTKLEVNRLGQGWQYPPQLLQYRGPLVRV